MQSAIERSSGISKRSPKTIIQKIREGKAVVAVTKAEQWTGFFYIEIWSNREFVSNSGLIVAPTYRLLGVAKRLKEKTFSLSRIKYPNAKIFSITTWLEIMKMNAQLRFGPVTFNEITKEPRFWKSCKSRVNYDILRQKRCKNYFCTAMMVVPELSKEAADNPIKTNAYDYLKRSDARAVPFKYKLQNALGEAEVFPMHGRVLVA